MGSRQPEILQDTHAGCGFVERIEMQAGRAITQKLLALGGGVFDAELGGRGVVCADLVESGCEGRGDVCAAKLGESFDLCGAQNGNDARQDRNGDAELAREVVAKFKETGVVEKKLGDDEVRTSPDLFLQVAPV